jgi:hypothetical protein
MTPTRVCPSRMGSQSMAVTMPIRLPSLLGTAPSSIGAGLGGVPPWITPAGAGVRNARSTGPQHIRRSLGTGPALLFGSTRSPGAVRCSDAVGLPGIGGHHHLTRPTKCPRPAVPGQFAGDDFVCAPSWHARAVRHLFEPSRPAADGISRRSASCWPFDRGRADLRWGAGNNQRLRGAWRGLSDHGAISVSCVVR